MGSQKARQTRSSKNDRGSEPINEKKPAKNNRASKPVIERKPVKQEAKKRKSVASVVSENFEERKKVKSELCADSNVNDTSFLAFQDVDEIVPISDEKYAEELQLQEALKYSSASVIPSPSSSSSKKPLMTLPVAIKPPRYSFCAICMDTKTASEMFENTNVCRHLYCQDCIRGHVAAKIKENVTKVKCPDTSCKGLIGPEVCRSIVPKQVLERWENILCEALINESHKFYCPFKDCSVMLVDDGGVTITSSECPNCHRLFCAQCKVAWHCGISCVEYQSLKKGEKSPNDTLLTNLAKEKRWMKCPNCRLFVEKTSGCNHISCRCGHHFCYRCGKPDNGHGHICTSVV